MSSDTRHLHVPLPKNTPAFFCADCGAVALDPDTICKPQGRGTRADWCGTKSENPPSYCRQHRHTARWHCKNCGTVSVNPELLCAPEKLSQPA